MPLASEERSLLASLARVGQEGVDDQNEDIRSLMASTARAEGEPLEEYARRVGLPEAPRLSRTQLQGSSFEDLRGAEGFVDAGVDLPLKGLQEGLFTAGMFLAGAIAKAGDFLAPDIVDENGNPIGFMGATAKGQEPDEYLFDIAEASHQDLTDNIGDFVATQDDPVTQFIAGTAGASITTAAEMTNLPKAILGVSTKAGLLAYGGYRAIKGLPGLRALRKTVDRAESIGDVVDAARDTDSAFSVAERVMNQFSPTIDDVDFGRAFSEGVSETLSEQSDELAGSIDSAIQGRSQRRIQEGLDRASVIRAEERARMATEVPSESPGRAAARQFEPRPEPLRAGADAGPAPSSGPGVGGGEGPLIPLDLPDPATETTWKKAARRSWQRLQDEGDEIAKRLSDSIEEVNRRAADVARKGASVPHTPLPTAAPVLAAANTKEFGRKLATEYVHNRHMANVTAATREISVKSDIPDAALRSDLVAVLQGTGNVAVSETDTAAAAAARVAAHEDGDRALGLLDRWREQTDRMFAEMAEMNAQVGDKEISYIDNWIHQAWKRDKAYQRARASFLSTKGAFEQERAIGSFFEGVTKHGLTPRTLDIAELMHISEREYGRVLAAKKMFRDIVEMGTLEDGNRAVIRAGKRKKTPSGYTLVQSRFFSRLVPGDGPTYLHDELYNELRNILNPARPPGPIAEKWDGLTAIAKRLNFSFSFFHAYSLTESAINAMGPVRGLRTAGSFGFGAPGLYPVMQRAGGAKGISKLMKSKTMEEAEVLASKYGVTVGIPKTDLMLDRFSDAVDFAAKKTSKVGGRQALGTYQWLQKQVDIALWDRFHHPMKVAAFNALFDDVLRVKRGQYSLAGLRPIKGLQKKSLASVSDDEIGRRVASFVNDEFGGQNWDLLTDKVMRHISDPEIVRSLRRIFLSPDWNISSFRASLAFAQAMPGTPFSDPVRGMLGLKHWRNAMLGSFAYANAINLALVGRTISDNEPGKRFWHIDSGVKDENGRRVYLQWGKQYRELLEFTTGSEAGPVPVAGFLLRKVNPYIGDFISPFSSPSGFGTRLADLRDRAIREGIELDGVDYGKAFAAQVGEDFLPFAVQQREMGPLLAAVPLPKSLGSPGGLTGATTRMAVAIREDNQEHLDEILKALEDNGYTHQQIKRALSSAKSKAAKFP